MTYRCSARHAERGSYGSAPTGLARAPVRRPRIAPSTGLLAVPGGRLQLLQGRTHGAPTTRLIARYVAPETAVTATTTPSTEPRVQHPIYDDDPDVVAAARAASARVNAPPGATSQSPPSPASPSAPKPSVASLDATRFKLHPSVNFWRTLSASPELLQSAPELYDAHGANPDTRENARDEVLARAARMAQQDPRAAAHLAYHVGRSTFFFSQGISLVLAQRVTESFPWLSRGSGSGANDASVDPVSGGIVRLLVDATKAGNGSSDGPGQGSLDTRPMQNLFREVVAMASQDYDNVRSGAYGLPWDMATPGHRQYDPAFVLRRSAQFLSDGVATLGRQARGTPDPVWLQGPGLYPHYYTKTFHYQTDGWLSDRSARYYEHITETIFFGMQDGMQRTALLPIADYINEQAQLHRRVPSRLRLLEVAAGTGRFHTFLKDTWPELPSVVSDLSPFYLAAARENLDYWRRSRQRGSQLGGVDGTGCEFLQVAAEDVPRPDGSFDMLVVMNLFHELPEAIRRRAASEFFRLLAPGGLLVLTDSVQSGDRLALDAVMPAFGDFNEPYYRNYFHCDLGALFSGVGFLPDTKYLASATKTLSFRKPASG